MSTTRKIKVIDSRFISAIRSYGPMLNPSYMDESTVKKLLNEGHILQELDSQGRCIILTQDNFNDPNRFSPRVISATNSVDNDVENSNYGKNAAIETEAATFTGYTTKTAINVPTSPDISDIPVAAMTKSQRRALRKAQAQAQENAKKDVTEEITDTKDDNVDSTVESNNE